MLGKKRRKKGRKKGWVGEGVGGWGDKMTENLKMIFKKLKTENLASTENQA